MQIERHQISRRNSQRFYAATAIFSLAIWLFMAVAETYTPLHAWLHGGTIPKDDDDCAVVALAHGKVDSVACDVPVVAPINWIEVTPQIDFSVFSPAIQNLPNGRGPPALGFA